MKKKFLITTVGLIVLAAIGSYVWRLESQGLGNAAVHFGAPYDVEPKNAELLHDAEDVALFAGETDVDVAHNEAVQKGEPEYHEIHNSLFLRQKTKEGTGVWRLIMTSGGVCGESFYVMKARLSADGHGIWLVCDPHIGTYYNVCHFDFDNNAFVVLCDGDSAEEQPDGTILIKNRKTYLQDEKGEPLGAAWYDEWIAPDGKVVRKSKPISKSELEKEL